MRLFSLLSSFLLLFIPVGCERPPQEVVVVYTALDRQFSEPILRAFEQQTGIRVEAVYDAESTKTVGLTNRIREEGRTSRTRCDVFWNNEILNTLRLKNEGLLRPFQPAEAAQFPAAFRDPDQQWYGFATRARVILVNTDLVPADARPTSIYDFADPRWKGQAAIARPLFGMTASHIACLYVKLGAPEAEAYLASLKANDVQVLAGNKTAAEAVGRGAIAFCMTDTDDAIIEIEAGRPVIVVFPDSGPDQMGTLLLPNTLALLKDSPNPSNAEKLADFLLTAAVEEQLARSPSAQIPLHKQANVTSRILAGVTLKQMEVDFTAAAAAFEQAARYIEKEFLAP